MARPAWPWVISFRDWSRSLYVWKPKHTDKTWRELGQTPLTGQLVLFSQNNRLNPSFGRTMSWYTKIYHRATWGNNSKIFQAWENSTPHRTKTSWRSQHISTPASQQARLTDTSFGHLRCARFRSHEGCEDVESLIDPILQAAIYTPRELAAFCNTSM